VAPGPSGTTILTVRPVDASGNLVGPGHAATFGVKGSGPKPLSGVLDRGDGTYSQVVDGKADIGDITVGDLPLIRTSL
jgi:hypothetical protein